MRRKERKMIYEEIWYDNTNNEEERSYFYKRRESEIYPFQYNVGNVI